MKTNLNELYIKKKINRPIYIIVAGAENLDVLKAVERVKQDLYINPVLLGNKKKIESLMHEKNISLDNAKIIDLVRVDEMVRLVSQYHKEEKPVILMKGKITTAGLMHEVIKKDNKLRDKKLLSHVAIFEIPYYHKLLCITDVAVNISPDVNDKKIIIENAVEIMNKIEVEYPKVACLSTIENVNPAIESSTDAALLREMNKKGQLKGCIVEGPFGLDNAISKESARIKEVENEVAGDADILLVPDLNSGNILYKSLIYFGNAKCAAIVTGAKVPIVLTSRTDTTENKYYSIILAIMMLDLS